MSYEDLRDRWCNIIVLNVQEPSEEKCDASKDSFYEELEQVFHHIPKYLMNILLGDFDTKVGREYIFKPAKENGSLHHDNGAIIVNFASSRNLVVKNKMFLHRDNHNYNWTSPDGKTLYQINHVLTDRRWHTIILDVRSCRVADRVLWSAKSTIKISLEAQRHPLAFPVVWSFLRGGESGIQYLIHLTNVQSARERKHKIELH